MTNSQFTAFLIIGFLAWAGYENAKEAHRHTHLILCTLEVEVEGAHCHGTY